MKKFASLLLSCLLILGSISCSEDGSNAPASSISVNDGETFLSLDALARWGSFTIAASEPWRVTRAAGDGWITLSAESGPAGTTKLDVQFAANNNAARTATLIFAAGDAIYPFRVSQSARNTEFTDTDYNFYITFATLPALYAGLHVLSHDKPSYFYYDRTQTFDPAQFPAHVSVTTGDRSASTATDQERARMRTDMMRRIREINAADPNAVFGLYTDDGRCRLGYDWFVAQGIDSARVKVSMLSDGTATYNNYYNYFNDPSTAEQTWNTYASQVETLDWNHQGRFPETRGVLEEFNSWEWVYYLATRPNYRLVLQDAALLEPATGFMGEKLAEMQLLSEKPYELLAGLPEPSRQQFFRMASFDYDRFETLFDASPKRNLIIIGTNASGLGIEEQQRAYVQRVVEQYGGTYNIFFKPHPADTSTADYEQRFGLKLLPGQMPFEIFVWSLIDKIDIIGGYPSTVFVTVPTEKVRFIFAPDAASLIRPLNVLFRNATDIEWIQ